MMRIMLVIVPDCPHAECKVDRDYDKWDLFLAPCALMPDDSIVVSKEDAQPILRLVMN